METKTIVALGDMDVTKDTRLTFDGEKITNQLGVKIAECLRNDENYAGNAKTVCRAMVERFHAAPELIKDRDDWKRRFEQLGLHTKSQKENLRSEKAELLEALKGILGAEGLTDANAWRVKGLQAIAKAEGK